jgi:eukaryotic-like serine/threonine-protein kinase
VETPASQPRSPDPAAVRTPGPLNPPTSPQVDTEELSPPRQDAPAAPPPKPAPLDVPQRRITALGDFRLGEKIGAGAMGAVYRAQQISQDRPAAVKVLRPHVAKNRLFLERFRREAQLMARLSHPNIVRCYGVGRQHGRHYLAMELVEGHSLGDWLYRLGKLPIADAVHIALAVARALQHAHQCGLVHRDIKPDNILITHDGQVKIADLGLAKAVLEDDLSATQTGQGAGTPVYMAPEQARDAKHADPRSDLYALGCVLYHMLTGQFPFRAPSSLEIILAKIEGHYTLPRDINPDIPPELEAVVTLLLSAHPDERYQSATDAVNELEDLSLAQPTLQFLREHSEPAPSAVSASTPTELTTLEEEKRWYVLYHTPEGKWVTRRLTTNQVLKSLKNEHFARTAQASLSQDDYRFLSDYPEFRDALAARKLDVTSARKAAAGPTPGALLSPGEKTTTRWRWRRLIRRALVFLAVGALGFWLGQLLVL